MVLANWSLQQGYRPREVSEWLRTVFVDGYEWVMTANVIRMATYADGGLMMTKPYAAGGAYIDRMTNFCGDCRYDPKQRTGEDACPFTRGYWAFLDRNVEVLQGNHRMAQPLAGLSRRGDIDQIRDESRPSRTPP